LQRQLWKRIAYTTRYGHIPLREALDMDAETAIFYLEALGELVREENTRPK
jgi:hypothetical protein